jgi:UDP-N-acetyl-D-mannosaminuronic acid dehydrogenase
MKVCVVGLGKIGLPLAAQFASKGAEVVGADILPSVVESINQGRAYFDEEPGLQERVAAAHAAGKLRATTNTVVATAESEVVLIVVPVLVGKQPPHTIDLSAMEAATRAVAQGLKANTLVLYETTLPVGTTRNVLTPILEAGSGLKAGVDFEVAFSPERVFSGRIFADLANYPKIVGGLTKRATEWACDFYAAALDAPEVRAMDSAEAAELVKLAETTYRDVNIAFANELARYADSVGVDIYPVIAAANTQPYSHIHQPGVGVGGHCIPVYPYFLANPAPESEMRLPRLSRQINDEMAAYAVQKLTDQVGDLNGQTVLILGLAYRGNVKEAAFSSTFKLVEALNAVGAKPLVHDPLYTDDEIRHYGLTPASLNPLPQVTAVILQAAHTAYESLDWGSIPGCKAVLDGRGVLNRQQVGGNMPLLWVGR